MNHIRGVSGVRGIYGSSLNLNVIKKYLFSFYNTFQFKTLLLARDSRKHGQDILQFSKKFLISNGINIIDCGIIPTPTAQIYLKNNVIDGYGVVFTASHNPDEWNGIKFINKDGLFLNNEQSKKLFSFFDSMNSEIDSENILGTETIIDDSIDFHVNHILKQSFFNFNKIKKTKIKIVVDAVNGAASKALPLLLESLDCELIKISCDDSQPFPRIPEPIPENLNMLSNAVVKNNADLGVATDPDGDRLSLVDNNGTPIGEEFTLALSFYHYLKKSKSNECMVTNLSSSSLSNFITSSLNSNLKRSPVGEINVIELMKIHNSPLGGEGNGGVIYKNSHLCRDSLIATTFILDLLAEEKNQSLSDILKIFPKFFMIKDKLIIENIDPLIALQKISTYFKENTQIKTDGIKILFKDKWLHIRSSNTEPIIRIIAESKCKSDTKKLIELVKKIILE